MANIVIQKIDLLGEKMLVEYPLGDIMVHQEHFSIRIYH